MVRSLYVNHSIRKASAQAVGTYTTCLLHTLSSQNLPMLKGAYKSKYVEARNKNFQKVFTFV
jgi:hypothetical protein